ncbi:MAG TPA: hypothetical protein VI457_11500 [Methylococcaceae bacterium]|nr:hypothetical protein [Methylococcaceae bacterium]
MTGVSAWQPLDRLLALLGIVRREGEHLIYSYQRVFPSPVTPEWVGGLEQDRERAERLEAFVSRYGRMQDTIADKLLPRWLAALAEPVGSQIENLNRAERLGAVEDTIQWLEARKLRNRLVHEYAIDPADFAEDLNLAAVYTPMLVETYNRLRIDLAKRLGIGEDQLPPFLSFPAA